ncbi:chlorophyll A-B binding protein [Aureococcus anophagefferens]|uniref:Chlorophyll A-B binding protein n=2 Tax=Aureococcus anophagefferens TaxID=44056 RepID=A0ABR1FRD8_AURAN|nr:putative plastid light harvesting protein isoform 16 [Aureococcus anophagefferens]EGB12138.1 putative plastid light harvesting protein isoform 16 [Aureococcus anophagefferens]KAH8073297.1 chlorophyll A-B binding protein [Aureococcus anophagefferens]|mmetsp:Transcript_29108/g.94255  ORF Transcript_29108/g.94255 Transcript_29108/m.94255 type:complete len:218 (-) Transcript_29108:160-813(-)|eukprot:XP_009033221.1 putative plastid light harvesting protein isoform 16 [Aureococcus anophagefferens]
MQKLIIALTAATASAFVAPSAAAPKTQLAAVQDMEGITMPMGLFDPFGFSNGCSDEALAWYREAEIKHGRVAMAAFVGFLVNYQGYTFPANLDMSGNKFASLGTGNPLLAWDNLSEKGKWSILGFVGLLEVLGEAEKPHYTKGGKSGSHELVWYFGSKYISGKSPEDRLRSRNAEINNGRLGMLGIMSLIAASTVPGSVPFFTSDLAQYTGDVWAPF